MGSSIKDIRSQGGWEVIQCRHFSDKGGSSNADVRTLCCKTSDFLKVVVCPHEQGELSQSGNFADKGERVNFSRFCAHVFYGRPLNTRVEKASIFP